MKRVVAAKKNESLYSVEISYVSSDIFEVYAENEDEAIELVKYGEFDDVVSSDYQEYDWNDVTVTKMK